MTKVSLKDAWKNFLQILKDPSSTKNVLLLSRAIDEPVFRKTYIELLDRNKEVSFDEISDLYPRLPYYKEGTVGHHVFANQKYPIDLLIRLSRAGRKNKQYMSANHPYAWMARRHLDSHDIWHTIAGYDMNYLGELCLAAFTYGQCKTRVYFLYALIGMIKHKFRPSVVFAICEGYSRGKKCSWLLQEDYEKLFDENLEECKKRLGLTAPKWYDRISKN
jgi:ubiquinone biosynthesis protein COQ4